MAQTHRVAHTLLLSVSLTWQQPSEAATVTVTPFPVRKLRRWERGLPTTPRPGDGRAWLPSLAEHPEPPPCTPTGPAGSARWTSASCRRAGSGSPDDPQACGQLSLWGRHPAPPSSVGTQSHPQGQLPARPCRRPADTSAKAETRRLPSPLPTPPPGRVNNALNRLCRSRKPRDLRLERTCRLLPPPSPPAPPGSCDLGQVPLGAIRATRSSSLWNSKQTGQEPVRESAPEGHGAQEEAAWLCARQEARDQGSGGPFPPQPGVTTTRPLTGRAAVGDRAMRCPPVQTQGSPTGWSLCVCFNDADALTDS